MTRGAAINPPNPFERLHVEEDLDGIEELRFVEPDWQPPSPRTAFYIDDAQSLITHNASPDIGFESSLNPYRGCEHGCSYCYARRYHEFLGFSAGIDFESKIMVKLRAPELLRRELSRLSWRPQTLACSGVTDPYQPVERKLEITRGCLAVLAEFRNPVGIITKNHLVTRDVDHLSELARWNAVRVFISVTSLDSDLARILEPRASMPAMRLRAIRTLAQAGIPVGASLAPVIPGLNDHEMPALLEAVAEAGATSAFYTLVRLPGSGAVVFDKWLDDHVSPEKKASILGRIREVHGGRLNDLRPSIRMNGEGERAAQIARMFEVCSRKFGLDQQRPEMTTAHFRRLQPGQLELGL
jgi:DNA repair photolyase